MYKVSTSWNGNDLRQKEGAIRIIVDAKFTLHKWHSNVAELEEIRVKEGWKTRALCQTAARPNKSKDRQFSWTLVGQTRRSDKCYYASI